MGFYENKEHNQMTENNRIISSGKMKTIRGNIVTCQCLAGMRYVTVAFPRNLHICVSLPRKITYHEKMHL